MTGALIPELYVEEIGRSLRFYGELGFVVLYQRPVERFAMLEREGAQIMLEEPIGRTFLAHPLSHPRGSGVSFQIAATDVERLWTTIPKDTRIVFPLESRTYQRRHDVLEVRQFVVTDPDGYVLRFSETIG